MEKKFVTPEEIEVTGAKNDEQEFTIIGMRNEDLVDVYASDNTFITKMKRCLKDNPEEFKCWEAGRDDEGKVTGYFFTFPKKYVSIRVKSVTRTMSEENKEAARQRFKEYWDSRKTEM